VTLSRDTSIEEGFTGRRSPIPKQYKDVEAKDHKDWRPQSDVVPSSTSALEHTIDTRTKFLYLGCWFVLNLVLTIYNKALLQGVSFIEENVHTHMLSLCLDQVPLAAYHTSHHLRVHRLLHLAA